jgi:ATP-dependent DNA helicase
MDRCHRIGQQKPVLVFRLATAHSVEGKMLKRANEKMALERVVIKKGVFKELLDQQVRDVVVWLADLKCSVLHFISAM